MSEATIRWQAQRIEELEAEVSELKAQIVCDASEDVQFALSKRFSLTPTEARILEALWFCRSEFARLDWLNERAEFGSAGGTDPEGKALAVYISRLRRRLGSDAITTFARRGYGLSESGRAFVEKAFNRKHGRAA